MKTKLPALIFWLSLVALATSTTAAVAAAAPRNDVLGLRLEMSKEAVHRRLAKIGRFEREERGRQEVWTLLNDPRFTSLLVGYDREYKVRYVTAIAREEGSRRMRYSEVAPLKEARVENANGVYRRYTWEVEPGKKRAGYFLFAEGRDPEYLKSLSIKRHPKKSASPETGEKPAEDDNLLL
jgi:hypothetical protein